MSADPSGVRFDGLELDIRLQVGDGDQLLGKAAIHSDANFERASRRSSRKIPRS